MNPVEAPPRRPLWRSIAGELVITLLVSALVWLIIGFGNKGFLQARGLAYSLAIGVSVYSTVAPVAASGEPFGYSAFERALADAGEGTPAALLENLVSRVESRVLPPRDDDWTVVALTRVPEGAG